jgi:hypothetical protein
VSGPRRLALAVAVVAAIARAAAAESHVVVITGLSGEPEQAEAFEQWGGRLVDAATTRYGVPPANVVYLAEKPDADAARIRGRATRENITKAFGDLARRVRPEDAVLVVLIGNGSAGGRFNLPGPDISAAEFAALLGRLPSRRVAFVDATSASSGFVQALAAPGRVVVAATRNEAEQYATLFGGFFIDGLTADAADTDKDRQISILEAFLYARRMVAQAYQRQGLLLTEHAVLDDNGDGAGAEEPGAQGQDGRVAAAFRLTGSAARASTVPQDPALAGLAAERQDLESRIAALKVLKGSMDPAKYAAELERLVTELAVKSREIREREKR